MRTLTAQALASLLKQETEVVWLILLTIDHPDLDNPIRLVHNNEDIVSNGNVYQAFPFRITLPPEDENRPPRVSLSVDNVDRQIVDAIRSIQSRPTVTLEIVTSLDYDTIEIGPMTFNLEDATYNAITVEGDLTYEPILNESYPAGSFNPSDFPSLF